MKRLLTVALAASLLALVGAAPGGAEPAGTVQPACADIVGDAPIYYPPSDPPAGVFGTLRTAAATCSDVRYTIVASYIQSGRQKIRAFTHVGGSDPVDDLDGTGFFQFGIELTADGDKACVAMYSTSTRRPKLYDAVPDAAAWTLPPTPATNCANGAWGLVTTEPPGGSSWYGG
jgi:hypothetical protein